MGETSHHDDDTHDLMYDVIVIGGGVVGLACARALTLSLNDVATDADANGHHGHHRHHHQDDRFRVCVVERQADLLDHASGGNSGIVCTGVDAPIEGLERTLIRDSISKLRPYCHRYRVPTRPCGSLVCTWPSSSSSSSSSTTTAAAPGGGGEGGGEESTEDDDNSHDSSTLLDEVLQESHNAGDTDARLLSPDQVHEMEPNLNPSCQGAVHVAGEIVLDSWLYSISLALNAQENGCHIYTCYEADVDRMVLTDGVWTVPRKVNMECEKEEKDDDETTDDAIHLPLQLTARLVVNAAGLWADVVERAVVANNKSADNGSVDPMWQARPRRGQYRIYRMTPTTHISHPIQPVPTPRTKGVFVFSNLYQNLLVVGPTAMDQSSKRDRSIDGQVAKQLDAVAQRTVPALDVDAQYVGDYVGIRPGTEHRDYQIHVKSNQRWIAVAGVRSTGLTASLGIGDYVVRLARRMLFPEERSTNDVQQPLVRKMKTTPLPSIEELVESYRSHQEKGKAGYVTIHGKDYRVTHPLSRWSFEELVRVKQQPQPPNGTSCIDRAVFNGGKMEHIFAFATVSGSNNNAYSDIFSSPQAREALENATHMYWKIDGACGLLRWNQQTRELELYERQDTRGQDPTADLVALPTGVGCCHNTTMYADSKDKKHTYYMRRVLVLNSDGKKAKKIKQMLLKILDDNREELVAAIREYGTADGHLSVELVGHKFQKTPGVNVDAALAVHCEQRIIPSSTQLPLPRSFEEAKKFLLCQHNVEGVILEWKGTFWKIRSNLMDPGCTFERDRSHAAAPLKFYQTKQG